MNADLGIKTVDKITQRQPAAGNSVLRSVSFD